jgi:sugar lactone lactonase YvrE
MTGVNGCSRLFHSAADFRFAFTRLSLAWMLPAAFGLLTAQLCTAQTAHYSRPAGAVNLGSVNVGSTSATAAVTFTLDTGGTLDASTPYQVLGQVGPTLDFADAGGSTCNGTTTYKAGDTCKVNVSFTPKLAGARYGIVNLYNAERKVIAARSLTGTAVGPQIAFFPGGLSTVIGNGLSGPAGVAVDGSGNLYIADSGHNRVVKETLSGGGYTESIVANDSLLSPDGVTVDGSGNVYIADSGNNRVLKETPSGSSYAESVVVDTSLNFPAGLAVDGSGDVYIADVGNNRVLEEAPSTGGYTQSVVVSLDANDLLASGVAVDGSGDVYLAFVNYALYPPEFSVVRETPSAGGYTQTFIMGVAFPAGVAVDGSGNVYAASDGNSVYVTGPGPLTDRVLTVASGLNLPNGVAVDGSGNVYIADSGNNRVLKENSANPPSLAFAATSNGSTSSDSPQIVTAINIGTAPLSFPVPPTGMNPSISANFTLPSDLSDWGCPQVFSNSTAPGTLAVGGVCELPVSFSPKAPAYGYLTGTATFTDNNLNASSPAYATQSISMTGRVIGVPPRGSIGPVVDSVTMSNTVGSSDMVEVTGWVADEVDGAPLSNVKVYIDGVLAGTPTLGIPRYDVAVAYENPAYLDSGYQFLYSAASLSLGTHAVTVIAIDSGGNSRTFGPVGFTVAATAGLSPPIGSIASPEDSATLSNTVGQSDSVDIRGWVVDPADGSPLSNVTVHIDGTLVAAPTLGIASPAVATKYSNPAYAHARFELLYPATSLALGNHEVTVVARDSGGRSTTLGPVTFTVAATAGPGSPFGGISFAGDSTTMTTTVSPSHSLEVAGWVADATDGSPLSNVNVYIDDVLAGPPTLGIASPSVATMYGNPAYGHAKYQFLYSAASLATGAHWVTVIAVDSGGRSTTFGPNIFTVE